MNDSRCYLCAARPSEPPRVSGVPVCRACKEYHELPQPHPSYTQSVHGWGPVASQKEDD